VAFHLCTFGALFLHFYFTINIYKLFIDGMTPCYIAKELTRREIPTPGGKKIWAGRTIESILTNEKYKGDALLQKKFTVDFLTKRQKINEGEVPQS